MQRSKNWLGLGLLVTCFVLFSLRPASAQSSIGHQIDHGPTLPTTCKVGQIYFQTTTATIGLYQCATANTWTAAGGGGTGSGDVVGPSSATDNAVVRFDSTTGKLVQNSGVTIDDSDNVTIPGGITAGTTTAGAAFQLGGASATAASALTIYGGDAATNAEPPYIRLIPSPVSGGAGTYFTACSTAGQASLETSALAADCTASKIIRTGTVAVANGGTGATTLTANNVVLGNGSSAVQFVAPGTSGNVLTSNGTTWSSSAAASGCCLYNSGTSVTAGGDSSEHNLMTYSLPGATINANGGVRVTGIIDRQTSGDTRTLKFYFGTKSLTLQSDAGDSYDRVVCEVYNTNATNAQVISCVAVIGSTSVVVGHSTNSVVDTATQDTTASVTVKFTNQSSTNANVIQRAMTVEKLN